jgi:diguanylate cyclase (GGDEF)-like protein
MRLVDAFQETNIMSKQAILLVQSVQTKGNDTQRHLEERGYKVVTANSGLTALMTARNENIDLIVLDVALPDIEGLELCRRLRARQEAAHSIPIILLTSRGYIPDRSAGASNGPDDYLSKPYSQGELDDRISVLLASKNSVDAEGKGGVEKQKPFLKIVPRRTAPGPVAEEVKDDAGSGKSDVASPLKTNDEVTSPSDASEGAAAPILPFHVTGDAVVDVSTGLFGRPQFEAMFSKEFKRAMRFKQQMSCMLINLDGRKMQLRAGEALVKAIIELVHRTIREVDTAAWWSGESIIILLPNTVRTDAVQAAARILNVVANHPFTCPDATNVTLSIGVAGLPDDNIDNEQKLIETAYTACQRAQDLMTPPNFDMRTIRR